MTIKNDAILGDPFTIRFTDKDFLFFGDCGPLLFGLVCYILYKMHFVLQ